jgi:hypothetical protein
MPPLEFINVDKKSSLNGPAVTERDQHSNCHRLARFLTIYEITSSRSSGCASSSLSNLTSASGGIDSPLS